MTAEITLDSISKRFGGVSAVESVSLTVEPGEFVALLGASGCGKSTTLRIMAGLERPDEGRVLFDGEDVTDKSASARNIALMFQSYALYPHLTVHQNIATPLRQRRLSASGRLPGVGWFGSKVRRVLSDIDKDVLRVAEMLRLGALLNRKPGQLSGGQQQRVALARALVRDPCAFLLDEPLSNLDTQLRGETRDEIRALHAKTGRPFVLVTHDQADALAMADRIAVMMQGRIAQLDTPERIFNRPKHRDVAAFVGAQPMNLLDPSPAAGALHPAGASHVVGVRPEHLAIRPDGALPATVLSAAFQGEETILQLAVGPDGSQMLRLKLRGNAPPPPQGATVRLDAHHAFVHLFDATSGDRLDDAATGEASVGGAAA